MTWGGTTGGAGRGGAAGSSKHPVYAFAIDVGGVGKLMCPRGIGCVIAGQGIIALIGMDVLVNYILIVNVLDGSFTLAS